MKKITFWKSLFLLCALIVGSSSVWADDYDLYYTLTPTSGSNNAYAGNCDVMVSGITWNVEGNSTLSSAWGLGGKSISNTDRKISSKTKMGSAISKIEMKASSESGITVNSVKLIVASDDAFANKIDEVSVTFSSGNTMTITPTSPLTEWTKDAYYRFVFNVTVSGNSNKKVSFTEAKFYKTKAPAYTISTTTNNEDYGTVSLTGSTITAFPKAGYRVKAGDEGYTVTSGTATVVNNGDNTFSVTPTTDCTIRINFEEGSKYTVTYNAGAGTCGTASATEATYQGGVVLPTATCTYSGWSFAGWAEASTASTSTRPTLYAAGSTYHPTANIPLYAVYSVEGIGGAQYKRAASVDEVTSASSVAIVTNKDGYILNYALTNGLAAPSEVEGKITMSDNYAFTLSGNNTEGFTISSTGNKNVGPNGAPTSGSKVLYIDTDITTKWIVEKYNNNDNIFVLRIAGSDGASMQYYSSDWVAYYTKNYSTDADGAMKIYVPEVIYNSNPTSAIIQPSVAFTSSDKKTLYLDGTKTYTNTASVTGVEKPVSSYISSNTSVATVNASGEVTAVGKGTATITAKLNPELGVHSAASAEYIVEVKNTTTIAGIKALASTQTQVQFSADLTDAVVTYVNGNHAYIQDESAAIYVNYTNHGLVAGQKINGAVSGYVKAPNQIDQIAEIDRSKATVTNDGIIPAAEVKTLAEIKAAGTDYDGKLVTVNAATITTGMTNATSGGKISDDNGTTTFNIIAPNNFTLTANEKGNFTSFVSIYVSGNTTTYRLNIYEASQYQKTQNVATAQELSFTSDAIELDEDTEDFTNFTPQTVGGAQGTVTYAIEGDEIYKDFNTTDGTFTLKTGVYGTATITATATAANITEGGVTTPYTETSKSYTVTTYPRYTSTFSMNGVVTVVRQATHGAEIAIPEPSDVGDYYFMGWKASTGINTPTDVAPEMVTPPATPTSNVTYYAVYAQERAGGEEDVISTLSLNQTEPTGSTSEVNDVTWSWNSVTFGSSGSSGMKASENASVTITLPSTALYAKSISLTCPNQDWGSGATVVLKAGNSELASLSKGGSYTFTNSDNTAGTYTMSQTTAKNAWINAFVLTYTVLGTENYGYRTSLPVVGITIPATGYLSYCSPYKLDFSETNVKAYTASVDNAGTVTLTKVDVVPAEEGVVLFSSEAQTANEAKDYTIPVTAEDASDVTGNQMVGVLTRTQVEWNPSDGVYNYILQQGEFRKATTPGGYLKANRAYLSTSYNVTAAGARPLTIVFEGETTRISNVDVNDNFDDNAPMYNLAGQKVGKSYKGIVIQNGKKVVRK